MAELSEAQVAAIAAVRRWRRRVSAMGTCVAAFVVAGVVWWAVTGDPAWAFNGVMSTVLLVTWGVESIALYWATGRVARAFPAEPQGAVREPVNVD